MMFAGKVVAITGAAGGIGQALCRHLRRGGRGDRRARQERRRCTAFAGDARGEGISVDACGGRHRRRRRPSRGLRASPAFGPVDILDQQCRRSRATRPSRAPIPTAGQHDVNGNLNGAYYCAHAVLPADEGATAAAHRQRRLGQRPLRARRPGLQRRQGRHDLADPVAGAWNTAASTSAPTSCCRARCARRSGTSARPKDPKVLEDAASAGIRSAASSSRSRWRASSAFLASDAAAAITGAALPVDCGLTAGNIVMARELTLEDF